MTETSRGTSTGAPGAVQFNPFEPGYIENPYDQFAALRHNDPAHITPFGPVFVTRYDDVFRLLRDPTLSVQDDHATPGPLEELSRQVLGDDELVSDRQRRSMLDRDPPDHTRLRKLVSRVFTPRRIADLRPRIQELVDAKLDRAAADGGMEAVGDLAFPLPFEVISEMLGMPETSQGKEASARIRDVSGTLVRSLEPVVDPEVIRAIAAAGVEMQQLIDDTIDWKRQHPADDLLTLLIDAEHDGDSLSDDELSAQVGLLFIAGHETTVNLIGNGLLALLRHPDQLQRLRDQPELADNAIEELLRFESPVQFTRRITLEPLDVAGTTVEPGTFVMCGLASANRDEGHFGPDADRLDIGRSDAHDHLAFGGGAHYCLGAALARLEAQVAIGSLIERFGTVELAGEPVYNGRINLRGLDQLPLRLA